MTYASRRFAVKAGAKHVIGVDMSTIIFKAREIVEANGMSDKITLIQGKMEEIDMPFPKGTQPQNGGGGVPLLLPPGPFTSQRIANTPFASRPIVATFCAGGLEFSAEDGELELARGDWVTGA